MKFKIEIDGVERTVEASADGKVTIDGKSFTTKVSGSDDKRSVRVGEKTYELRLGKRIEGEEGAPSEYLFEVSGEKVAVVAKDVTKESPQVPTEAPGGAATPSAASADAGAAQECTDGVFAPVPGKVLDVRVKVGDKVSEGDVVLVLEAMKMENELHASKAATIAAVLVNKGDQAAKDQLLVAFE